MTARQSVDVLVVGAGPAGLAAASAAAERGRRVVQLDLGIHPGGQIWRHRHRASLPAIARRLIDRTRAAKVELVNRASVIDAPEPGRLLVEVAGKVQEYHAQRIILCTGARERFLPFPGWTLPGVVGIGGLQALIKGGLKVAGSRVALAGSGPLLLPVGAAAAEHGARLTLVAEQASLGALARFGSKVLLDSNRLAQAIRYRSTIGMVRFRTGTWVTRALGNQRLSEVEVTDGRRTWVVPCEWLGTSYGLVPNTELAQLLNCAVTNRGVVVDNQQHTSESGVYAAGECTGVKGEIAAIVEGEIAGASAAGDTTAALDRARQLQREEGCQFAALLSTTFAPRPELLSLAQPDTIVCRCEDVVRGALDPVWTQRQAKLWTRVGMGACQGAVCGPACAALFGWEPNKVQPPIGSPTVGSWTNAD